MQDGDSTEMGLTGMLTRKSVATYHVPLQEEGHAG